MSKKKIDIVEGIKSKKGLIGEFKEFISRGNVIDLAVGVVMGSAFTAIVTSLVNDMITPLIGLIMGGIDFSDLKVIIPSASEGVKDAEICYGKFIQAVINFLITAFVIFMIIKGLNMVSDKFKKKEEEKPASTKICPYCQSEINIKAVKCPHCTSDVE